MMTVNNLTKLIYFWNSFICSHGLAFNMGNLGKMSWRICNDKNLRQFCKYQGLKEFHLLAHMSCYSKIMVFGPLKPIACQRQLHFFLLSFNTRLADLQEWGLGRKTRFHSQPCSGRSGNVVLNNEHNLNVAVKIGILNIIFAKLIEIILSKFGKFWSQATYSSFTHFKT